MRIFCWAGRYPTSEEREQRIGAAQGVPTFGLDALSSAAYGPEAAPTILLPLGMAGLHWIVPLSGGIIVRLAIVYFSYRQTIAAYSGGGSYTVASRNLGARAGLPAGAALMINYLLNVAVGISAGVGARVSAVPSLQSRTLAVCLGILAILRLVNLQGVREPVVLFMIPTYVFASCLRTVIAPGAAAAAVSGSHLQPAVAPPRLPAASEAVSPWPLFNAFSCGCTAMSGVEAVSNGVPPFREPVVKTARRMLAVIIGLLSGIAWLARVIKSGRPPRGSPVIRACFRSSRPPWLVTESSTRSRSAPFWRFFRFPRIRPSRIFRGSAGQRPRIATCRTRSPCASGGWCTRRASGHWRSWRPFCWSSSEALPIA